MEQITLRLETRLLAELERDARDANRTRSEHIRHLLETRREHDRLQEEHVREIDELEQTIARLRNEKRVLTDAYQINDETQEIVRYRKERESAGVVGRAKLWLFGPD